MCLLLAESYGPFARLVVEWFGDIAWTVAADRDEAIEAIDGGGHDGLVTDLWLGSQADGWSIAQHTRRQAPEAPVLVLAPERSAAIARQARALGVELGCKARWHAAIAGHRDRIAKTAAFRLRQFGRRHRLTGREVEVLRLYVERRRAAEIAAELGIAVPTVRTHLARIRIRSGYQSLADLREEIA